MAPAEPKFACATCGKEYRWKPEMAGKRAKCKCGQAVTVPAEALGAADPPELDAIEFGDAPSAPPPPPPPPPPPAKGKRPAAKSVAAEAPVDDAACPSCGATLDAGAVLCVNCGYNLKTGKQLDGAVLGASPPPPPPPPPGAPDASATVGAAEASEPAWKGLLTIGGGLVLVAFGVMYLVNPYEPDESGGRRRRGLRIILSFLYDVAGNAAVVGALLLLGAAVIVGGVMQVRGKKS